MDKNVKRRDFLKTVTQTTAVAVATAGTASAAIPKKKRISLKGPLPVRTLGKTKTKLPMLYYGGVALVKAWGNPNTEDYRVDLLHHAYKRGIRCFDTAGNYLESERIIGKAFKGKNRDKIFLATKTETNDVPEVRKQVEKSLKELQTDYLDLIQIHGAPGLDTMSVQQAMKIHAELVKLQDEGMVRFIGVTSHAQFHKTLELISTGGFDQCMLAYGYLPKGLDQMFSPKLLALREACLKKAQELNVGIIAMKVMNGGILGAFSRRTVPDFDERKRKQLPAAAIRYVMKDKRVDGLVIGMRLKEEIDTNVKTISSRARYSSKDRALLTEFSQKALNSRQLKNLKVE